eukprot:3933610-Rhodomonas_salina.6
MSKKFDEENPVPSPESMKTSTTLQPEPYSLWTSNKQHQTQSTKVGQSLQTPTRHNISSNSQTASLLQVYQKQQPVSLQSHAPMQNSLTDENKGTVSPPHGKTGIQKHDVLVSKSNVDTSHSNTNKTSTNIDSSLSTLAPQESISDFERALAQAQALGEFVPMQQEFGTNANMNKSSTKQEL